MTTTTCKGSVAYPTPPADWLNRALDPIRHGWASWREHARQRAEWRAIDALDDATRRDIGLGDRGVVGIDHDRVLWMHDRGQW